MPSSPVQDLGDFPGSLIVFQREQDVLQLVARRASRGDDAVRGHPARADAAGRRLPLAGGARRRRPTPILGVATARLDKALDRGQCGMWDWDVANGIIFWSRSMFDILGMPVKGDFLSFAEVAEPHPPGTTRSSRRRSNSCSTGEITVLRPGIPHAPRGRPLGLAQGPRWRWRRAKAERPAASHRHRLRHHPAEASRQAQQGGRASADGCGREHLGGLRAVGCRQPAGAVQFQVPAVPFAARLGLRAGHAL